MADKVLFKIPIAPTNGDFTCTSPADKVYLLTFNSPPDNRLLSAFIEAFLLSLDIIEERFEPGVVITTSKIPKFYSNGLDLEHVLSTPDFWEAKYAKLCERLLIYSMPTIALSPGHAFAGGFFTALFHDYRVQNPSKGFLCLNEIDIGMVIPQFMMSVVREKLGTGDAYRDAALEGRRFSGAEALKAGIVDALGGLDEALALARDRKLVAKANSGPWGPMKEDMYKDTLAHTRDFQGGMQRRTRMQEERDVMAEERGKRVAAWEKSAGRSKL